MNARFGSSLALALLALVAASRSTELRALPAAPAEAAGLRRIIADYGRLPWVFERAIDRESGAPRFIARGATAAIAISAQGIRLASTPVAADEAARAPVPELRFAGANPDAVIRGVGRVATRIHHLRGAAGESDVDAAAYERVIVADLYPGIDVAFHASAGRLEYDVIVAPGADPSWFVLRAGEALALSLSDTGDVVLTAPGRTLQLERPVAYQDIDGERRSVESRFVRVGERDVRFDVGTYDRTRELVIDPVVTYATYVGGNSFEQGIAIAVDAAGSAYVAGYTASTDFPTLSAFDRSLGKRNDVDAFVAKLNPAGTALVWSTYIGGAASADRIVGIAVDAAGSAYVAGNTSGGDFPTTANAWQKAIASGGAFVAKLAPTGNALAYSTYVGGANASGIALDGFGNAHVSGSATPAFVATPGAFQRTAPNAASAGFVLKLDASGSAPLYATFLGGSGSDDATSIAVDAAGSAYVGGWTTSFDFPTRDAFQATRGAGKDAFVAKLDASGSRLVYATLLGGSLDDAVNAIAVDAAGFAYVAGETYSSDFPVKDGFQTRKAGKNLVNASVGNAFVAKLATTGSALVYSSFLGGEICLSLCQLLLGPQPQYRADAAYGIAVDAAGHAYVTGIARSYTFPLVDSSAPRKTMDNQDSAFVAKMSISGGALLWSTFLRTGFGESDAQYTRFPTGAATAVAIDAAGAAYVTGDADSASNFQPTPGAFQTSSTFGPAVVVVKFAPSPAMSLATSSASVDAQTPITLTATLAGAPLSGTVTFMDGAAPIGSAPLAANKAVMTTTLAAGIHPLGAILRIPGTPTDAPILLELVDPPLACVAH